MVHEMEMEDDKMDVYKLNKGSWWSVQLALKRS